MRLLFHIKKEKEGLEKSFNKRNISLATSLILILILVTASIQNVEAQLIGIGKKTPTNDDISLSYVNPQEYEIAEITVTGLETIDQNALISLSGLKVGDKIKIPGEAISEAIKKIWKNGIIGDVSIYVSKVEGDKAYLVLELTERARLARINIYGVSKAHQTELKEEHLDLIKGRVISDATRKNAELAVKEFFNGKGFLNAEVKTNIEKDSILRNGASLNIYVKKNAKVKINEITFIGNEAYGDKKLRSKMKKTGEKLRFDLFKEAFEVATTTSPKKAVELATKSYPVTKEEMQEYMGDNINLNFFKSSRYKRKEYKEDKKKVIHFYNSKGYRDARILSDSIYKSDINEINIDLRVEEGKKYYFGDIIWSGNFVYNDDILNRVLGVEKGDVYDMDLIQKKLTFNPNGEDISSLYMDNGYLFFQVNPVETRINGDSIDVEMRVYEGDQAKINKIIVTGNDRTHDHVIRREIRTIPGDYFNRSLLIRTQRELSQLGYFNPETIEINPMPNMSDGTVDIEYKLEERPSDQIELSGGWGGYYKFVGTVGLVFNNFSVRNITNFKKWKPLPVGDGQRLSLRVQANGRQYQNYSVSFTEPWLGGKKPTSFTFGLNRSVVRSFYDPTTGSYNYNKENGSMVMNTVSVGLGKRLKWPDDYFTLTNTLSFSHYVFDNYNSGAIGITDGTARNLMYNMTISRNSIDNPMFPRNGSLLSLSVSLTPPYSLWRDIDYKNATPDDLYGWIEYHKWMFDAKYFSKLIGNMVFSFRAHLGFIGTYTHEAPTGPFDRFQLGGSGLSGANSWLVGYDIVGLRGYEDNSITPPYFNSSLDPDRLKGGVAYDKFVFELRYPVTTSQATSIYVLAFAEGGNNFHKLAEFDPFSMYKSVGFGARIFMPAFGLMGIDWAYGFDKLPGSSVISGPQFHFSIGDQFR